MNIKPLGWKRTSLRNIKANGRPLTTETWVARNVFKEYKVYSSASGRCFVILGEPDPDALPGFYAGDLLGPPKTPCKSVADGKRMAEKHWREKLGTVLTK
jgi:hypothetical protein